MPDAPTIYRISNARGPYLAFSSALALSIFMASWLRLYIDTEFHFTLYKYKLATAFVCATADILFLTVFIYHSALFAKKFYGSILDLFTIAFSIFIVSLALFHFNIGMLDFFIYTSEDGLKGALIVAVDTFLKGGFLDLFEVFHIELYDQHFYGPIGYIFGGCMVAVRAIWSFWFGLVVFTLRARLVGVLGRLSR